jgi:hypothetical protein
VTAALPPGEEKLFRIAMELGRSYQPLSEAENQKVIEMAQGLNPIFKVA